MNAYYNENDPFAAQWLRNLIAQGLIASGDVDERSIADVRPDDLNGYTQCHFFAGIGGWSVALRLASWPDDRPVWTGSCPCQPFSAAGAGKAGDDERHLWPAWFSLIRERAPAIVFGEQVEAAIGWGWLDVVFADLEAEGYACGPTVLPACGVGAPHIRQRIWFVADAGRRSDERGGRPGETPSAAGPSQEKTWQRERGGPAVGAGGASCSLADTNGGDASAEGLQRGREQRQQPQDGGTVQLGDPEGVRVGAGLRDHRKERQRIVAANAGTVSDVADAASRGQREFGDASQPGSGRHADSGFGARVLADPERDGGRTDEPQRETQERIADGRLGAWNGIEWLKCTDGKLRPVESGSFPLAHGVQRRTSKLRAYGNAIVPQVACEFIIAADQAMRDAA